MEQINATDNPYATSEPSVSRIAHPRKYYVQRAWGHDGDTLLGFQATGELVFLKADFEPILKQAWDDLTATDKSSLKAAGFEGEMKDKMDKTLWQIAFYKLKVAALRVWLDNWKAAGNEITGWHKNKAGVEVWHYSSHIQDTLGEYATTLNYLTGKLKKVAR